jgi:SpoVK/Ycf46/Vps4 family AAA+-type ATPase
MTRHVGQGALEPIDFVRIILENKVNIINRTDILELLPEGSMDQIGGLDLLKDWLGKRAPAMTSQEARDFGIDPPKGVLLVGPPGGGKSQIAMASAQELGVAGIKFDISKVFASLVGKSEERTRTALSMIDAMAPCLVLFDGCDHG